MFTLVQLGNKNISYFVLNLILCCIIISKLFQFYFNYLVINQTIQNRPNNLYKQVIDMTMTILSFVQYFITNTQKILLQDFPEILEH